MTSSASRTVEWLPEMALVTEFAAAVLESSAEADVYDRLAAAITRLVGEHTDFRLSCHDAEGRLVQRLAGGRSAPFPQAGTARECPPALAGVLASGRLTQVEGELRSVGLQVLAGDGGAPSAEDRRAAYVLGLVGSSGCCGGLCLLGHGLEATGPVLEALARLAAIAVGRLRQHEAQREIAERYRLIANNVPDIIYSLDGTGSVVNINAAAFERYGFGDQGARGRPFLDFVHPDDHEILIASFMKALEEQRGVTTGLRFRIVAESGAVHWFELNAHARFDADGGYLGEEGVLRDITERKQTEEALRESEDKLRRLFDGAHDGIALMQLDGRLVSVNESFARMHGYSVAELLGRHMHELETTETRQHAPERLQRLLSGEDLSFEAQHFHKAGHAFPLEVSAGLLATGRESYVQSFHRDITERRRSEHERLRLEGLLHQAQKMESVGRLAGGVAHDFNNILGVILGNAEIALQEPGASQAVQADLAEIHVAASRAADLTRQLLAFARKQTIAPRILDLNETVTGMLKLLQRLIGEDIELSWVPQAGLWPVMMDRSQFDQILANLCVNARDAIAGVGRLTIETGNAVLDDAFCAAHLDCVPGDYVRLCVTDSGSGMDRETLAHLFEPFFTTKEPGRGTGLGLATTYGAVKQNGGVIEVLSEPGRGTRFTIFLPRHEDVVADVPTAARETPAARGQETILLVEDDPAILKLTARMLERQGYTVLVAPSPGEALRLAKSCGHTIDLLVTDVIMPEMNGRELARGLREIRPSLGVLFMSGHPADVIAKHGVLDDVNFLDKPFSREDLSAKVRAVLDRPR